MAEQFAVVIVVSIVPPAISSSCSSLSCSGLVFSSLIFVFLQFCPPSRQQIKPPSSYDDGLLVVCCGSDQLQVDVGAQHGRAIFGGDGGIHRAAGNIFELFVLNLFWFVGFFAHGGWFFIFSQAAASE
jgi:hypothetical protein